MGYLAQRFASMKFTGRVFVQRAALLAYELSCAYFATEVEGLDVPGSSLSGPSTCSFALRWADPSTPSWVAHYDAPPIRVAHPNPAALVGVTTGRPSDVWDMLTLFGGKALAQLVSRGQLPRDAMDLSLIHI